MDEFSKNLFSDIWRLWLKPELEKRKTQGQLPEGFKLQHALILFYPNNPPRVYLNSEHGYKMKMILRPGGPTMQKDEGIPFHRIIGLAELEDLKYDGKRAGFIYLRRNVYFPDWFIIFDCSPNWPNYESEKDIARKRILHYIGNIELLNQFLRYFKITEPLRTKIINNGFIQAPWVLPSPFHNIACHLDRDDVNAANTEMLNAFPPEKVQALIKELDFGGKSIFRKAIEEAYEAFARSHFIAAICTILPLIEGMISEFLLPKIDRLPESLKGDRGKINLMKEKRSEVIDAYFEQALLDVYIEFLEKSELLKQFDWGQSRINMLLPNRHMVFHGCFDESMFTETNFIKILLVVDALDYILSSKFAPES